MSKVKKILNFVGVTTALLAPALLARPANASSAVGATTGKFGGSSITPITPIGKADLFDIINTISIVVLAFLGVLAVAYLVYGGVLYLTAGGEAEKASKGRTAITNAIIGVVVVLLSIVIYNFVLSNVSG